MDLTKLKKHIPDNVIEQIPQVIEKFQINTPLRLSHFLAQCRTESGNFTVTVENLSYSAKGLMGIFSKYFKDEATANLYARKPEKIANKVYSNRMGNGDEASGDGYKFCGRGYIQLTGKTNYCAFDALVPEDIAGTPNLVSLKYPLLSAAWFFSQNGLNQIADKGPDDKIITLVSKRVNGGTNGLEERIKNFKEIYPLLA